MKRQWTTLLALGIAVGFAFAAFAQDEPGPPPRQRRAEREEAREGRERPDREAMRERERTEARGAPRLVAMRLLNFALETEEGKAIAEELAEKTEAMLEARHEAMLALREKVREARQEGADREGIEAMVEEARAEASKQQEEFVKAQLEALKKLIAIVEENLDDITEQMTERMAGRPGGPEQRRGREQREDRPRRRAE